MNNLFMLLNILRSPRSFLSLGGLALIAMVYMFGPMLGLRGSLRLIVVGSLLVLFLVLQGFCSWVEHVSGPSGTVVYS